MTTNASQILEANNNTSGLGLFAIGLGLLLKLCRHRMLMREDSEMIKLRSTSSREDKRFYSWNKLLKKEEYMSSEASESEWKPFDRQVMRCSRVSVSSADSNVMRKPTLCKFASVDEAKLRSDSMRLTLEAIKILKCNPPRLQFDLHYTYTLQRLQVNLKKLTGMRSLTDSYCFILIKISDLQKLTTFTLASLPRTVSSSLVLDQSFNFSIDLNQTDNLVFDFFGIATDSQDCLAGGNTSRMLADLLKIKNAVTIKGAKCHIYGKFRIKIKKEWIGHQSVEFNSIWRDLTIPALDNEETCEPEDTVRVSNSNRVRTIGEALIDLCFNDTEETLSVTVLELQLNRTSAIVASNQTYWTATLMKGEKIVSSAKQDFEEGGNTAGFQFQVNKMKARQNTSLGLWLHLCQRDQKELTSKVVGAVCLGGSCFATDQGEEHWSCIFESKRLNQKQIWHRILAYF
ncbi:hypothetical protein Ciccas_008161 [Cichlidogyrus casuarinus]|uniref:Uncharacterized protein n=1 Tax=Cichlidogyrus casuarinus TaxID=1844966 RepID=A0ABD2Q0R2_9PLAT